LVRIHADRPGAADALRGAGLAGDGVRRAAPRRVVAGAAGLHGHLHALAHRLHVLRLVADGHRRGLRQRPPRRFIAVAPRARQVQPAQVAVVGERSRGAHQLQRRRLPEALADARDHGLAGVPRLAAVLPLPLRRGHDTLALADQVDAGALAEAVAARPLREPLDAHVQGQLLVVGIDRGGDGLAQVGPAVAAGVRVAVVAALARDVELAGGHDAVLRRAQAAVEPGQRHE